MYLLLFADEIKDYYTDSVNINNTWTGSEVCQEF